MSASTGMEPPSRAQVRAWWQDVETGRCMRWEASDWALAHLEDGQADEELVIQGLLYLQALTLVPVPGRDQLAHSRVPGAPSFDSLAEVGVALTKWEAQLREYDADPDAWMRGYFRRMISDHAGWRGGDAARRFARKLVRAGHLTTEDVEQALGEHRHREEDEAPPPAPRSVVDLD
ncbi:hypothetical protein JL107_06310 [Nakamurella flavida]|uniref:Uncharacterized protein n=1 Tax=Nakamurella flavida TaxID=363630 RepID=A0A938YK64_9ACTN|nr:hypothetical protein [Nakamurella flavida]MBM9476051.1 hypothetical protein [Nakamurella flavida]MDP9777206.1 hypothetical protein [Nakamurella flavida]